MKNFILILITLLLFNISVNATNIRGRLLRNNQYGVPMTLGGIRVDIIIWNGNQWISAAYAITGSDGFYYFLNFAPGVSFYIKVFGTFYPSQPLMIQRIVPPYYQDVSPIYT